MKDASRFTLLQYYYHLPHQFSSDHMGIQVCCILDRVGSDHNSLPLCFRKNRMWIGILCHCVSERVGFALRFLSTVCFRKSRIWIEILCHCVSERVGCGSRIFLLCLKRVGFKLIIGIQVCCVSERVTRIWISILCCEIHRKSWIQICTL